MKSSVTTNKACGGDGIPVELFQILKDDAVKVLYSICQQIWKTQQWPQDWKRSVFIPIAKNAQTTVQLIALISHASKVMLKFLQARLQKYVNCELPDVQAGFRKGRVSGAAGVRPNRDKVTGPERNLQGSSSSRGAALGAQYVPLGAAGTRKESARQLFPSRSFWGPSMSLSSFSLTVVGFSINFWKYNI